MLAGTRLGMAGANIANLAASHLPFASYPQPCASYRLFYRQPSPATVAENWRMPAKLRLVASAPPADASHWSQRMSSLFPARSQRVRQSLSSALPAVYFYWGGISKESEIELIVE